MLCEIMAWLILLAVALVVSALLLTSLRRQAQLAASARASAAHAALHNTLLASISHDLRNPLAAISSAAGLIAESQLDERRRATLGRLIEEKARDMAELLGHVLELVRLEATPKPLRGEWQSLPELAGSALGRCRQRLDRRQVLTSIPPDFPRLRVDGQLIIQVLANLLDNAAKYTPPETSIFISAEVSDDEVQVVLEDNGPGFMTGDPEALFDRFMRGPAACHGEGVGLGLAICRAIVELHGGSIRAMNGSAGGARFEIALPLPTAAFKGPLGSAAGLPAPEFVYS